MFVKPKNVYTYMCKLFHNSIIIQQQLFEKYLKQEECCNFLYGNCDTTNVITSTA